MLDDSLNLRNEEDISKNAIDFIYKMAKDKELYRVFMDGDYYKSSDIPQTFFMAGSPGAGKTEWSKNFVKEISKIDDLIVRIDADEIRELCPGYNGANSHLFQGATSVGVNKLYDYALKKRLNVLLDSTFSSYKYAESNIRRAIDKKRDVDIFYIYQEPVIAWEFTQKREKLENRKITIETFINDFISAKENIEKVKEIFKDKIKLTVIKKDYNNDLDKTWINVANIDSYVKFDYTSESLYELIKNVKI